MQVIKRDGSCVDYDRDVYKRQPVYSAGCAIRYTADCRSRSAIATGTTIR